VVSNNQAVDLLLACHSHQFIGWSTSQDQRLDVRALYPVVLQDSTGYS
jgi:hypothetical protein